MRRPWPQSPSPSTVSSPRTLDARLLYGSAISDLDWAVSREQGMQKHIRALNRRRAEFAVVGWSDSTVPHFHPRLGHKMVAGAFVSPAL